MQDNSLEAQADLLAEAALHELGAALLDDEDYETQCNYAGCFPWLAEVIHAHPHETTAHVARNRGDTLDDELMFTC